jgi:hypothetical protein
MLLYASEENKMRTVSDGAFVTVVQSFAPWRKRGRMKKRPLGEEIANLSFAGYARKRLGSSVLKYGGHFWRS